MIGVKISKIEYYTPDNVLDNKEVSSIMPGWTAKKIYDKIGINSRYISASNESALDLAAEACLKIGKCLDFNQIESLILCTQSPEYLLPTGACILQNRIGLKSNTMCFDFNLGCSGYIYGLAIAKGLIQSKIIKNCLFVTADTYSKYLDVKDGSNRAIFGDGATVTFLESTEENQIFDFVLGTDGSGSNNLIVNGGATKDIQNSKPVLYMNGAEIFDFTNKSVPLLVSDTLKENSMELGDIDYFVFHQANMYMLDHLRKKIGIPLDKFLVDMENFGNTVSSTIPIVLANKLNSGLNQLRGKRIMLVGFGVGYSWGAVIIKL
jgi:3-oxoacyl-[acyl-carrier-protein] synthase III